MGPFYLIRPLTLNFVQKSLIVVYHEPGVHLFGGNGFRNRKVPRKWFSTLNETPRDTQISFCLDISVHDVSNSLSRPTIYRKIYIEIS